MCTLNEHSIYYNMLILKIQQNVALLQALNKEIKQLYVSWSHEVHIYLETLFEEEATEMSESLDNNMVNFASILKISNKYLKHNYFSVQIM